MHVEDPRGKFAVKKTNKNEYRVDSKINIPSSGQRRFADMYVYYQNVDIVRQYNVQ